MELCELRRVMMTSHVLKEPTVNGNPKTSGWLMDNNFPNDPRNNNEDSQISSPEQPKEQCSAHKSSQFHIRRHRERHFLNYLKRKRAGSFAKLDRYERTFQVLQQSGLLKITAAIFQLSRDSESLQKEINKLQEETTEFSRHLIEQQHKR